LSKQSIYEPFGIINLEAKARETAVVASTVGGIKEVVVEGETGYPVPLEEMQESLSNRWIPTSFRAIWLNESIDGRRKVTEKKFGWTGRKRKSPAGQRLPLKRKRCTSR
jgi:glycosyltransferase involved in cell wall biosynthesis